LDAETFPNNTNTMPNLNKVMLIGNLTRDPELRRTPRGTAVTQLGLAVNRSWKNDAGEQQEETTFVDVEFFGRTAEVAKEYLAKGRSVFVEGRLKLDQWDDKDTGQKRQKMRVIGETLQMLGGKPANAGGQAAPAPAPGSAARPARPAYKAPLDELDDQSDIPF
jgi:single-strand DNA-binding protein